MEYAEKIRELRVDRDLSQKDIAKLLNTSQSYYAQYENSKRALPIHHLKALCDFYKISADYILGLSDDLLYPKR